jgi:hypothetical protein
MTVGEQSIENPSTTAESTEEEPLAEEETERHCVDCGIRSPSQVSEYTLIGSRYGWRLTKTARPDGRPLLQWRCRGCFADYRAKADSSR